MLKGKWTKYTLEFKIETVRAVRSAATGEVGRKPIDIT